MSVSYVAKNASYAARLASNRVSCYRPLQHNANGVTVTLNGMHYDKNEKHWYVDTTVTNTSDTEINVSTLESTVNGQNAALQMYIRCPAV